MRRAASVLLLLVLHPRPVVAAARPITVYLNFEGARLTRGGNNAATNTTELITVESLDYPALGWERWGGRDQAQPAILEELRVLYLNVAVSFVTTRPTTGRYTTALVGGLGDGVVRPGPGAVGVAPLDCENREESDLVLVFGDKVTAGAPTRLATVIAHELGHSFGLEHVEDRKSIMFPALTEETCCWITSPVQLPSSCGRTVQDDGRVLLDNLGPGSGDHLPPAVWFVRPGAGAILGSSFELEVAAVDDTRVERVVLLVDGGIRAELWRPPYVATLGGLSDGEHLLRAEAYDFAQNTAVAELSLTVDARCAELGRCSPGRSATDSLEDTGCGVAGPARGPLPGIVLSALAMICRTWRRRSLTRACPPARSAIRSSRRCGTARTPARSAGSRAGAGSPSRAGR
jgi:hypothetical protein